MKDRYFRLRSLRLALALAVAASLWQVALPVPATAGTARQDQAPNTAMQQSPEAIDWLEPQGISVIDLVGQVPEDYLRGAILQYTTGYGIMRYESGRRDGNVVTITARIYPRLLVNTDGSSATMFGCLGQPAAMDQLGVGQPRSTLRVFVDGREVTREVNLYGYVPLGMIKPALNPRQSQAASTYRYPKVPFQQTSFTAQGELIVPANMGCEFAMLSRNYTEMVGVFTVESPAVTRISVLGTQQFQHHSYLGAGNRGILNSLANQLYAAGYPGRAESYTMSIPPGTDHFFLNFPPSPVDPYTQSPANPLANANRPSGGTYRVGIPQGLSVDHVSSMGLPMYGHWQDVDQAPNTTWLPYSKTPVRLTAPEYFVPAGVAYHSCMTNGGCPADLLARVYNTAMIMRIVYLKIESIDPGLQRIPLRMTGGAWSATQGAISPDSLPDAGPLNRRTYLPFAFKQTVPPLDDNSAGCSPVGGCGWFAANGRMVDYIPAP